MCLGIPGQVLEIRDDAGLRMATDVLRAMADAVETELGEPLPCGPARDRRAHRRARTAHRRTASRGRG